MKRRLMLGEESKLNASTLLLLHFDTDVKDYSLYNNPVANNGCLFATGVFGSSIRRTNTTASILPPSNFLDKLVLNNDFTIDCWVYYTGGNIYIITKNKSGDAAGVDFAISQDRIICGNYGNSNYFTRIESPQVVPYNAWTHVAVVVKGSTILLFIDGIKVKTGSIDNRKLPSYDTRIMNRTWIGSDDVYSQNLMDELRVSNVARWVSNFTPPTKPY